MRESEATYKNHYGHTQNKSGGGDRHNTSPPVFAAEKSRESASSSPSLRAYVRPCGSAKWNTCRTKAKDAAVFVNTSRPTVNCVERDKYRVKPLDAGCIHKGA